MSTFAVAIPSTLVLIAATGCGLASAMARRDRSFHSGACSRADRCRARPIFAELRTTWFVLDALVEASDDLTAPLGMPFSLRLVPPDQGDDYLFSRLRAMVERGHPLTVEIQEGRAGRMARLCANGWTAVLPVEQTSGWPAPAPVERAI